MMAVSLWYHSINAPPVFLCNQKILAYLGRFCSAKDSCKHCTVIPDCMVLYLGKETLFSVSSLYEVAFLDCFGGKVRVLLLALGTLLCLDVLVPLGGFTMVSWRDPHVLLFEELCISSISDHSGDFWLPSPDRTLVCLNPDASRPRQIAATCIHLQPKR